MTMARSQVNHVSSRYLDVLGSNLPINERVSLSKLSPSDVPAWADARMQDYRRRLKEIEGYIATVGSLRNTQSSIHVLPSELLAKIFVYVCTTRRGLRITRVCRHWHAVVTNIPHVWVDAMESKPLYCQHPADQDFLRVALARSGSLPLTLYTIYFHTAWNILSPHSFQLVSLTVDTSQDEEVATLAAALSSGSLLNLRTLQVMARMHRTAPRLSLDSRYLPHLRKLYIQGALLTSTSTVSTLENLTISCGVREPWHVLGRALQRCVALRTLALLSPMPLTWADQDDSHDADLQAVSLPQLRSVTLEDEANLLRKMLRCLPIPSSTAVKIIMRGTGRTLLDAVPHNYMQRFHTQPLIDSLHIYRTEFSYNTVARCYAGSQERLYIAANTYGENATQEFLEPLFLASLHTLAIDMRMDTPEPMSWDVLFQRLPHLRRLELLGRTSQHAVKVHFAVTFLRNCSNHYPDAASSGLTLAWVVPADPEEGEVLLELDALASVLEGAPARCERLELYATKPSDSEEEEEFQSLAAIPTDPDLFRTVVAPILPRLSGLVDVLTIH